MKKLLLLVIGVALLYFGWQWYAKRRDTQNVQTNPAFDLSNNSETSNVGNVTIHCITAGDVNTITNKNYSLINEVFTPAVRLLDCSYQNTDQTGNVFPTISYKIQLTNDANGIWSRKQATVKGTPSYKDSSDYANAFADLNPVREIDQGTFYGEVDGRYIELTYTPVAEGTDALFSDGMKLLEKALNN